MSLRAMEENGEVEMFEIYFTYCLIGTYFGKKYQSLLGKTLYSISLPSLGSSFKKHKKLSFKQPTLYSSNWALSDKVKLPI